MVVIAKEFCLENTNGQENGFAHHDLLDGPILPRSEADKAIVAMLIANGAIDKGEYIQTHTVLLKELHKMSSLKGKFDTVSDGKDLHTPNCWVRFRGNAVMQVFRFGQGIKECDNWFTTPSGYTSCFFNQELDWRNIAKEYGGTVVGGKATFIKFKDANNFALELTGRSLPPLPDDRPVVFEQVSCRDGKATIKVIVESGPKEFIPGWGKEFRRLVYSFTTEAETVDVYKYLTVARRIVDQDNKPICYVINTGDNKWREEGSKEVQCTLRNNFNLTKDDADLRLYDIIKYPLTIDNKPFSPEFLPGGKWNRNGAQYVQPTKPESHPTFDKVFKHSGDYLTEYLRDDMWCRRYNVTTGGQYLRLWVASILQFPDRKLPVLWFDSVREHTGKTAVKDAISALFVRGAFDGTHILIEKFNARLESSVFCYVDDSVIPPESWNKIKSFCSSNQISIRVMNKDSRTARNYSHWILCSNEIIVPIPKNDTRCVIIKPDVLTDEIPRDKPKQDEHGNNISPSLLELLKTEAPSFVATCLATKLPPSNERLYLPTIQTRAKCEVQGIRYFDRSALVARALEVGNIEDDCEKVLAKYGSGDWSDNPKHFAHQLKSMADRLAEHGITCEVSQRKRIYLWRA